MQSHRASTQVGARARTCVHPPRRDRDTIRFQRGPGGKYKHMRGPHCVRAQGNAGAGHAQTLFTPTGLAYPALGAQCSHVAGHPGTTHSHFGKPFGLTDEAGPPGPQAGPRETPSPVARHRDTSGHLPVRQPYASAGGGGRGVRCVGSRAADAPSLGRMQPARRDVSGAEGSQTEPGTSGQRADRRGLCQRGTTALQPTSTREPQT